MKSDEIRWRETAAMRRRHWGIFCKHGCNLRMNESIFSADTKRLLRYKNIPNFLQTCKLHWLLYDYNLNVWMCFSASKCNLILTKRERAGSFSSSNMHKSMKCMKLSLLLFLRRLGGTRVSVSSFSCFKTSGHADLSSMSCFFHSELLQNKSPQKLSYKHQV